MPSAGGIGYLVSCEVSAGVDRSQFDGRTGHGRRPVCAGPDGWVLSVPVHRTDLPIRAMSVSVHNIERVILTMSISVHRATV